MTRSNLALFPWILDFTTKSKGHGNALHRPRAAIPNVHEEPQDPADGRWTYVPTPSGSRPGLPRRQIDLWAAFHSQSPYAAAEDEPFAMAGRLETRPTSPGRSRGTAAAARHNGRFRDSVSPSKPQEDA